MPLHKKQEYIAPNNVRLQHVDKLRDVPKLIWWGMGDK